MTGNEGDRDLVDPSRTGQLAAPPDDAEVERAIASVPGVTSAALRRDPDSGRTRLRLRLRSGEDAEQAAWSIAATLRERFGIALDPASIRPVSASETSEHEVSEAAEGAAEVPADHTPTHDADDAGATSEPGGPASPPQMPTPAPPPAPTPPPAPRTTVSAESGHDGSPSSASRAGDRATIHRLDIDRGAREVQATVALLRGEQTARGIARAVPTTRSVLRAVAEATASALQQFMTAPLLIGIDRIEVEPAADPAHVLVAVTILADRGEEQLLGVSLVRGDAERAVVRATLDALNRRVSPFLTGEPEREPAAAG